MKYITLVMLYLTCNLWAATPAQAEDWPDLPASDAALSALRESPTVQAAIHGSQASTAAGARIAAGPYEWSVQASGYQRHLHDIGANQSDWYAGLTTTVRLPGKSALDEEIGRQTVQEGMLSLGDAMHEAGRILLAAWFDWQSASHEADIWQHQSNLAIQQLAAIEKRIRAGDASQLDGDLARSAMLQTNMSLQQARLSEQNARLRLQQRYPTLQLAKHPSDIHPQPVEHPMQWWIDSGFSDNHELQLAQNASQTAGLKARLADAERTPDPTVSLQYMSEQSGLTSFVGVSVSVPIAGELRRRTSDEQHALASMAHQKELAVRQRLQETWSIEWNTATSNWQAWQLAQQARQLSERNADKTARAYLLGEASLNDTLLARRQALDAALAENQSAVQASLARYRLMLDTHHLWAIEPEANISATSHP